MSMEILVTSLLDLAHELPDLPKPLLVGGGFGLYLKQRHLEDQPDVRTVISGELWPPARATEDIDLLLPTEVIVSLRHMQSIRAALERLGYLPSVEFFHFIKETPKGRVKVDFLTCDIPFAQRSKVKISLPRVRPVGEVELHAYLTREALALELHPFELTLRGTMSSGAPVELVIAIPNSFTYLLMELHAFHDRIHDERKNLASHHALDIYRIVAMLTRDEYDMVRSLSKTHADAEPVATAAEIVQEHFADVGDLGILRLLSGMGQSGLRASDVRLDEFVEVLAELVARESRL